MKTAIVFNKNSGFSKEMSATEFERNYIGNSDQNIPPAHTGELENLEAVSKSDALPLTFRKSHFRMGRTERVGACWVRPDGFGNRDHLFDHEGQQSLSEAVQEGKSVLLSLNLDLTPRPVSFQHMQERGVQTLDNWIGNNHGNFITVSINSAEQAIKTIKKVHELGGSLSDDVFALHRNAVLPYRNFYLGDNRQKMAQLYNKMQHGRAGTPEGATRMVGFPRLLCFVPTDKTVDTKGTQGIKGNVLRAESGKPYINNLIMADRSTILASDPYKILQEEMSNATPEFILASPGAVITDDKEAWKMLLWTIKDVDSQITSLDEAGQDKLLDHVEKMNYNCQRVKQAIKDRQQDNDNDNDQDHPSV